MAAEHSTLKLYNVPFNDADNYIIEEIDSFLTNYAISGMVFDYQFVRHDFNVIVKLGVSQVGAAHLSPNYCTIQNSTDKTAGYYFIKKIDQVSVGTLRYTLQMDVLNTMAGYRLYDGTYRWGAFSPSNLREQTHVTRTHKDRFYHDLSVNLSAVRRKIDRISEGITPQLERVNDTQISSTSTVDNNDWYLIFNSNQEQGLYDAYLAPSRQTICRLSTQTNSTGLFASNRGVVTSSTNIAYIYNKASQYVGKFDSVRSLNIDGITNTQTVKGVLIDYKNVSTLEGRYITSVPRLRLFCTDGVFELNEIKATDNNGFITRVSIFSSTETLFQFSSICGLNTDNSNYYMYTAVQMPTTWSEFTRGTLITQGLINRSIPAFDLSLVNNLSTVISIQRLSYCPLEVTWESGDLIGYRFDDFGCTLDSTEPWSTFIKLPSNSIGYRSSFSISSTTPFNFEYIDLSTTSKSTTKYYTRESKLFHSDFYYPKIYFDIYQMIFEPEKLVRNNNYVDSSSNIQMQYYTSFLPTNESMLKLTYGDNFTYKTEEDYPLILQVNKDNSLPVYNSEYLNYLRYGEQYDRKQMALSNAAASMNAIIDIGMNIANAALNPAGALAEVASIAGKKNALQVAGVATDAASNIFTIGFQIAQQQNSLAAKKAQMLNSKISCSVSNNIEMFNVYNSGHKFRICNYDTPYYIKNMIFNHLFNHGYTADLYQTPDYNSRTFFNYFQCQPAYKYNIGQTTDTIGSLSNLDILTAKYSEGVTVFHKVNGSWDIWKEKENWETWLYALLPN